MESLITESSSTLPPAQQNGLQSVLPAASSTFPGPGWFFRRYFPLPMIGLSLLGDTNSPFQPFPEVSPPIQVKRFLAYQIRLPMTGACLLSGLTLAILSPPRISPGSWTNSLFIMAGYLLLILGIVLRIWSILHIQKRKSVSLVMTGPYSLCRNPLYVGTLLIVTGYLCMVQSATLTGFFIPVVLLYAWGVVPAEETVLRNRHGHEYAAYCRNVPRWRPRFSQIRPDLFRSTCWSWSSAVRREVECGGWWMLVAVLVHLLCSYRMASWWRHPLMWP